MRCSEFLLRYSEFRDETMADPAGRRRFMTHLSRCRRCARYHHAIDRGVTLLRAAEPVEPSRRFRSKLARKLAAAILNPEPRFALPVRFVGSVAVGAAVAILVLNGVDRDAGTVEPLPVPERPMPMVQAHQGPPFVTFGDLPSPGRLLELTRGNGDDRQPASRGLVTLTGLANPE